MEIKERGKRGQISIEYLILIGFVVFIVIIMIAVSLQYTSGIEDRLKQNQIDAFANKIVNSAEIVFFAGEPSKITLSVYLPRGVDSVTVNTDEIVFNYNLTSGSNVRAYGSDVPLTGSITNWDGVKSVELLAQETSVAVSSN
tara:strand:+ start:3636 stop:4061 length:426 start_codon:yes stop_codon:yes gene_type:complete